MDSKCKVKTLIDNLNNDLKETNEIINSLNAQETKVKEQKIAMYATKAYIEDLIKQLLSDRQECSVTELKTKKGSK